MREVDQALYDHIDQFVGFTKGKMRRENLKYDSIYDLFLKEGFFGNPDPYTPAEENMIRKAFKYLSRTPQIKQCYYNAQAIALDSDLGYAEGQILNPDIGIPLEHGFNYLPSGKVVDVTVRPMGEKNTCNVEKLIERARRNQKNAYLGLPFPDDLIRKTWLQTKQAIMLLEYPPIQKIIYENGFPQEWKQGASSPSLSASKPSPEEDWLNQPEREEHEPDDTHSPFEGDIPPWAQQGYEGVFPLAKKVFYITAYELLGPVEISRSPAPAKSPVMGAALHVTNVGDMPSGEFASDFMYHRFAAIPVRHEDLGEGGEIVDYLTRLIKELGVYGKILVEDRFPSGDEVQIQGGRWFPVSGEPRTYGGIDFLNAYNENRFYGGSEEGGWWYDTGEPVASVPIRSEDPASRLEWDAYLREKVGWTSQHDTGSVLGHDVFGTRLEDFFAREFPEETPQYG